MTQPTSVTVEGMQRATTDFEEAISRATSDRSRIEGEVQALRAAWTGDAANTFQLAAEAWLSHMSAIIQGLESLRGAMQSGGQSYNTTHQGTVDAASRAQSTVAGASVPAGLVF